MAAFEVDFRREAEIEVAAAERFVGQLGPAAVGRWRTRLLAVIAELERDPRQFPEADEAAAVGPDLRMALFGRRPNVYRVLFTIDGQVVTVIRVRHSARGGMSADDL